MTAEIIEILLREEISIGEDNNTIIRETIEIILLKMVIIINKDLIIQEIINIKKRGVLGLTFINKMIGDFTIKIKGEITGLEETEVLLLTMILREIMATIIIAEIKEEGIIDIIMVQATIIIIIIISIIKEVIK
jgi:hypothetical protein